MSQNKVMVATSKEPQPWSKLNAHNQGCKLPWSTNDQGYEQSTIMSQHISTKPTREGLRYLYPTVVSTGTSEKCFCLLKNKINWDKTLKQTIAKFGPLGFF